MSKSKSKAKSKARANSRKSTTANANARNNTAANKSRNKKRPVALLIAAIAAVVLIVVGLIVFFVHKNNTAKPHFQANVTINVDGKAYTPKDADVIGADSFSIHEDGSVYYVINKGVNGTQDVTIKIDGMDEPLILRTFLTDEKAHAELNVNADVDSTTKRALVTGELKVDAFAEYPEIWSIYRDLDMAVPAENMDKIGGMF